MRRLADLPNRAGFEFIGVRADLTLVPSVVIWDETRGIFTTEYPFSELVGWYPFK